MRNHAYYSDAETLHRIISEKFCKVPASDKKAFTHDASIHVH